jgi:hypothetical protein
VVMWQPRTAGIPAPVVPLPVPGPVRTRRRLPLLAGVVGAAALLALLVGTGVVLMRGHGPANGPDPRPVAVISHQPSARPSKAPGTAAGTGPSTAPSAGAATDGAGTATNATDTGNPTNQTDPTGTRTQADTTNDGTPPTVPMLPGMGSQLPTVPGH